MINSIPIFTQQGDDRLDLKSYVEEIKLHLTGNLLELEIEDETIVKVIYSAFREMQRYIDLTVYETMPFSSCINLNPRKVNAVAQVFRATALANSSTDTTGQTQTPSSNNILSISYSGMQTDPMQLGMWQGLTGFGGYSNYNQYVANYMAYSTAQQIRNTMSTDLDFRFDRATNNLYINASMGNPNYVTVKYIPRFDDPCDIYSDFWIDMIVRMSVAMTKIILGRIRSRYTQSNALWTMDGDTLLNEGTAELTALRTELKENTQLFYPVD